MPSQKEKIYYTLTVFFQYSGWQTVFIKPHLQTHQKKLGISPNI